MQLRHLIYSRYNYMSFSQSKCFISMQVGATLAPLLYGNTYIIYYL